MVTTVHSHCRCWSSAGGFSGLDITLTSPISALLRLNFFKPICHHIPSLHG
jgi:hypothetical protein